MDNKRTLFFTGIFLLVATMAGTLAIVVQRVQYRNADPPVVQLAQVQESNTQEDIAPEITVEVEATPAPTATPAQTPILDFLAEATATPEPADIIIPGIAPDEDTSASLAMAGITPTTEPTETPVQTTITGEVRSPDGGAVGGVWITVMGRDDKEEVVSIGGVSNDEGVYTVRDVPSGPITVMAQPPANSFLYAPDAIELIIRKGEERDGIDIVLDPGDVVDGYVKNDAGEPIEEASVVAATTRGQRVYTTDKAGYFTVEGIPPGGTLMSLTVVHPDYQAETRTAISMLDGTQYYTLSKSNDIILEVKWMLDGTPVDLYAYRMLKRHMTGQFFDQDRKEILVDSEDGRTVLENLEEGEWRAEVTVLDPDGQTTDIKASATFALTSDEKGRVIPVEVAAGRLITGTVWLDNVGNQPVAGAQLEFVQPSQGYGRFPAPDEAFQFPTATTNESGFFMFEGMAPGVYALVAKKDDLLTPRTIDVEVSYQMDPQPLDIVMTEGAEIYGTVIGPDGELAPNQEVQIAVNRPNADGWEHRNILTDSTGSYTFRAVRAGVTYIYARHESGMNDSSSVDLEPGQREEVNFDFSNTIELSGVITLNGGNPHPDISHIMFVGQDVGRREWVLLGPRGEYSTRVPPGEYFLRAHGGNAPSGDMDPFMISGSGQQEFNYDIQAAGVDVIVEFPDGEEFREGYLVLSRAERSMRYNFVRANLGQENRHFVRLFAGEYIATYTSRDNQWRGETDFTYVGPGQENVLIIDAEKMVRGVRIGGWSPGDMSLTEHTPIRYDVTSILESAGDIEIILNYEVGRHAVEIGGVLLLENGSEIDRDLHIGWSGADKWHNAYRLYLPDTRAGATYQIEALLRGDGGDDSTGSVYMNLN